MFLSVLFFFVFQELFRPALSKAVLCFSFCIDFLQLKRDSSSNSFEINDRICIDF